MNRQFTKTVTIKAVDEENRTATGAVLVPNELDHQADFLRPEAIERFYNEDPETGVMHAAFPDDAAEFERLEVIDEPETIDGEEFPPGTLIGTRKYKDDELWQFVSDGVLTGFSIGGDVSRIDEHSTVPDDVRVPEDVEVSEGPAVELVDGMINEVSDVDLPAVPRATYKDELGKSILEDVDGEEQFVTVMTEQRGHDEEQARNLYQYLTDVRDKSVKVSKNFDADVFRIVADENSDMFSEGDVLGLGVDFPNHDVFVDWKIDQWPGDSQLGGPHVSVYDSIDDAKQVAQGNVEIVDNVDADSQKPIVLPNGAEFETFDACVREISGDGTSEQQARRICGAAHNMNKVDINGTEVDLTPPPRVVNAASEGMAAKEEYDDISDCGTGVGEAMARRIVNVDLTPEILLNGGDVSQNDPETYLRGHESDIEGTPSEWSEEDWTGGCAEVQHALWGFYPDWFEGVKEDIRDAMQQMSNKNIEDPEFDIGDSVTWEFSGAPVHGLVADIDEQFTVSGNEITGEEGEAVYLIHDWEEEAQAYDTEGTAKPESRLNESQKDLPPIEEADTKSSLLARLKSVVGLGADDGNEPEDPDANKDNNMSNENKSDPPEWADDLTEKVDQIEKRVNEMEEEEEDSEKSVEDAPEWAEELSEKVDGLDERVETISKQSGTSQQLGKSGDGSTEKSGFTLDPR